MHQVEARILDTFFALLVLIGVFVQRDLNRYVLILFTCLLLIACK